MGEPDVGNSSSGEAESREVVEPFEMCQPGVRDPGVDEFDVGEGRLPLQMREPAVANGQSSD